MKATRVDPSSTQSLSEIEKYLRSLNEGDQVAIRNTQGGMLEFKITLVTGTNPSAGRIYTKHRGGWGRNAWYAKSGKNCYAPKGQSTLVIPTPEVIKYADTTKIPDCYLVAPGSHMV